MKKNINTEKRGAALLVTLIMLCIASFISISLAQYIKTSVHMDNAKIEGMKAFYIAESGVNKVVDFFNHPETYPGNSSSEPNSMQTMSTLSRVAANSTLGNFRTTAASTTIDSTHLFYYDKTTDTFPNLESQLENGDVVIDDTVYPSFNSLDNDLFGQVSELVIMPKGENAPPNAFARIKSRGVTKLGFDKTVYVYLFAGSPAASSPAALISKKGAQLNGDIEVRWGEVWIKEQGNLPNWNRWDNLCDPSDPGWTRLLTEDLFTFKSITSGQGSDSNINGNANYLYLDGSKQGLDEPIIDPNHDRYYNPCRPIATLDEFDNRILQHQDIDFPEFDYYEYKELAQRRGEYYSTDANGDLYRNGIETDANKVASIYDEIFNGNPNSTDVRYVFIDTIDGNAPNTEGTNIATISINGQSPYFQGMLYANCDIEMSGMGSSPTIGATDPDGNVHQLTKTFVKGIVFCAGQMIFSGVQGNSMIYGSLIVERGISETGTPAVYYDEKLKGNSFLPLNSRVSVLLYAIN